jgi:hypothetical protein
MSVTVHMHGNLRRFLPEGQDRTTMEVGWSPSTGLPARRLVSCRMATCLIVSNLSQVDEGACDESPVRDHDVEEGGGFRGL